MRGINRSHRYWRHTDASVYHYESGLKHLPLILLSAFGIATAGNGISLVMGAPYLLGLLASVGLSGLKLYFLLRYEPRYEQRVANRRDKVLGYVILAIVLTVLAAFGLFGLRETGGLSPLIASATANSSATLMSFFRTTVAKNTYAIICWLVAVVIEVIILIIVARDHNEYEYVG